MIRVMKLTNGAIEEMLKLFARDIQEISRNEEVRIAQCSQFDERKS